MSKLAIPLLFSLLCMTAFSQDRAAASKELASHTGHELKPSSENAPSFPPGISYSGTITEDDAVAIAL